MSYGLDLLNAAGQLVASTDAYNMHYIGQANFFSSQKFQSSPSSQYDNFYIESESAPMPFIVNRPGRYSTILSINRDAVNPQNWNIVVLTGDAAPHSIGLITEANPHYWPQITSNFLTKYSFSFNALPPPTVLCFARLPNAATLLNPSAYGIALFDAQSRVAFDSDRLPLDPDCMAIAAVPAPAFYRSHCRSAGNSTYVPGQCFYYNTINTPGWTPIDVGLISGEAATSFGPMPANPAFFFASEAEAFAAIGPNPSNPDFASQNYVPAACVVGSEVHVKWASRAVIQSPSTVPTYLRGELQAMTLVVDADRYI